MKQEADSRDGMM